MEAGRPFVIRVALGIEDETTKRAAHSLASHPGIDEAVLLAPVTSNTFNTVDDATGCAVVVGHTAPTGAGTIPVAVSGTELDVPGYHTASIYGLALALAVGVSDVETIAVAAPDFAGNGIQVMFPSPIDLVDATSKEVDGHTLLQGHTPELAAALVRAGGLDRVIMDQPDFLNGIALAAAGALVIDHPPSQPEPVWTRARQYLKIAIAMGLVLGERPNR